MAEERFELALGFVHKDGQTVLATAGKPVGGRGKIGRQVGDM